MDEKYLTKMKSPLVSVIIPAYNVAAYLPATIGSVLAQTYPSVEIVVVDDGSTDDTADVLAPYAQERKIIFLRQANAGVAAARNAALRVAKGEFVALLDADDLFMPKKIERQVAYLMAHPACDVSCCDIFHFFDGEPEKLFRFGGVDYSGDDVFPNLLRRSFINPLTVVMRRSAVDRIGFFNERYHGTEDYDFFLRLAYAGARFEHLAETLGKYRMRRDGLSYKPASEIYRKKTNLEIVAAIVGRMSPAERKQYRTASILFRHRIRLWYAELAGYFPPLVWLHRRIQKKRLAST